MLTTTTAGCRSERSPSRAPSTTSGGRGRSATTKLDNAFTDLERDDDGLARVELLDPDDERRSSLWLDESYPYLQLFTGDPLPTCRRSLAVEPMTCPPNAFRSGEGVLVLEPGESTTAAWGIDYEA